MAKQTPIFSVQNANWASSGSSIVVIRKRIVSPANSQNSCPALKMPFVLTLNHQLQNHSKFKVKRNMFYTGLS
jgi:hypothetical protein